MIKKNDLIEKVIETKEMTKKDATEIVDGIFNTLATALENGDAVDIYGFGKFEVAERSARTGFNPAKGEKIQIPASKTVKFKAAKALKDKVA